jgi:hypothetical protein
MRSLPCPVPSTPPSLWGKTQEAIPIPSQCSCALSSPYHCLISLLIIIFLLFEMVSHCVAQAGLKLLGSNDPSFSQVGEHHHARLELITWENHSVRFLFL